MTELEYDYADEDEYANRQRHVLCVRCRKEAFETQQVLERKGWLLSAVEKCPSCYASDAQFEAGVQLGRCQHLNDSLPEVTEPLLSAHIPTPFEGEKL